MFLKKPAAVRYLRLRLPTHTQEVVVGSGLGAWIIKEIEHRGYTGVVLLIDENVFHIHRPWIRPLEARLSPIARLLIPPTEHSKHLNTLTHLLNVCADAGLNRHGCIIGVGGGIIGDLAGFFASVYMRGIDFIYIPTTLMGQGDTVMQKVAISHRHYKNIIGNFSSPSLTICDTDFLTSLPVQEITLGLSEVIKHAMVGSLPLFAQLEQTLHPRMTGWKQYPWLDIIYRSLKVKATLVEQDAFDKNGIHKGLSYGHTIANALEGLSRYKLRHGEAVAIGMHLASRVSLALGILSQKNFDRQSNLMYMANLLPNVKHSVELKDFVALLKKDKLSPGGTINLVLPTCIGSFTVHHLINERIIVNELKNLMPTV